MIKFLARVPQGWMVHSAITPMHFPAGEVHLKVPAESNETPLAALVTGTDLNDYMALAQWADVCHQQGHKAVGLIPYLPGARQDRGMPFGAKQYADIINAANLDTVVCFDPHSEVMPSLINNLVVLDSARVVRQAVFGRSGTNDGYVGVIAPDDGAKARAEKTAAALHLPVYYAHKHRDFETGKLSGFSCDELPAEGRFLVVDDICDGGGTFIGLADVIGIERERLSLWVSHGVFSGKANLLTEKFGRIYTTDSHPGARREDVGASVTAILPYLLVEAQNHTTNNH